MPENGRYPVVRWLGTQDVSVQGSGGSSTRSTQINAGLIRLALGASQNIRVAVGDSSIVATSSSVLMVGPGIEFISIDSGQYIAAISNDSNTAVLNITAVAQL